jgi:hypothetical protein
VKVKALAVTALALLVLAAAAYAKTYSLHGKVNEFRGNGNATVQAKTSSKKGIGKKVLSFKVSNLDYNCSDGTKGEKSASLGSFKIHRDANGTAWGGARTVDGVVWQVQGSSNKAGTKLKGTVTFRFYPDGPPTDPDPIEPPNSCDALGGADFVAKK